MTPARLFERLILVILVFVVVTFHRAEWPEGNAKHVIVVAAGVGYVALRIWGLTSRDDPTTERRERKEFEEYLSTGISRSQFYGIGCLILGFGLLIPIAASCLKYDTLREMTGSLICAGIGPLPLIVLGFYLLRTKPKQPEPNSPESP
jgi:hypothetical protein